MVDFDAEIQHQTNRLGEVIALKIKIEGAIELLNLLKQKAIEDAKVAEVKVEDTVKAVEAEIVNKI